MAEIATALIIASIKQEQSQEDITQSPLLQQQEQKQKLLISGHNSGYFLLFNLKNLKLIYGQKLAESKIIGIVELGDDKRVAACSYDGSVFLFDLIMKNVTMKFQGHEEAVNCIDCQKYSHIIATGSDDCTIKIWKLDSQITSKKVKSFLDQTIENFNQRVTALVFLVSNPRLLLSSCYNKIHVWDIHNRELLYTVGKHVNEIYKIAVIEQEQFFGQQNVILEYINQEAPDPIDENFSASLKDTQSYQSYRIQDDQLQQQQYDVIPQNLLANNQDNVVDVNKYYIITFGLDHMIKLWDHSISLRKPIFMIKDNLKEFSKIDAIGQISLLYNSKLDTPCFISTADRDNKVQLWRLKKQEKPQENEFGVSYQFIEDNLF